LNLEKQYSELVTFFGEENLEFEYFNDNIEDMEGLNPSEIIKKIFSMVKLTHLPTGKVFFGKEYESQIENAINTMKDLKRNLAGNKFK
jgi:uncharacterized Ntn-hydrolase superfamily protein|tara:strand:+ start:104 stop:367 length:264 start_codon:yes stop_codon:yes gene_type:complete